MGNKHPKSSPFDSEIVRSLVNVIACECILLILDGGDNRHHNLAKFKKADCKEQGGTIFKMLAAFENRLEYGNNATASHECNIDEFQIAYLTQNKLS